MKDPLEVISTLVNAVDLLSELSFYQTQCIKKIAEGRSNPVAFAREAMIGSSPYVSEAHEIIKKVIEEARGFVDSVNTVK